MCSVVKGRGLIVDKISGLFVISKYLSTGVERSHFPSPISLSRNGQDFSLKFERVGNTTLEREARTGGHFIGVVCG